MEMTGLVGMMTTVPPPGDVVATVEELMLDGGRGVRIPKGGRTITGFLGLSPDSETGFLSLFSSSFIRSANIFVPTVSVELLVEVDDVVVVESEFFARPL